jgi:DNA-binding beta-propeller fold protein YncE
MKSTKILMIICLSIFSNNSANAQLVISGNENKIDLSSGSQEVRPHAGSDTITIFDFSTFPPGRNTIANVRNTVIGPPSNIAVTPDGKLALIADSLQINPDNPKETIPANRIHILDLSKKPYRIIGEVTAGAQPSGMSITPNGKLALVANRADGTVSVLKIDGKQVKLIYSLTVCEKDEQASDVSITPDGKQAFVSINGAGHLLRLKIDGDHVTATDQKISAFGKPYRTIVTPDGELALTAGGGFGKAPDADAITVIDLKSNPIKTIEYITIGSGPESIELSPDGKLLALVLMNGSNLPADDSSRTQNGLLVIYKREGKTFTKHQEFKVGRIPEGVAFTSDGKHLLVQCHPAREVWIYKVNGMTVHEVTGLSEENIKNNPSLRNFHPAHMKVNGFPSSLRAVP